MKAIICALMLWPLSCATAGPSAMNVCDNCTSVNVTNSNPVTLATEQKPKLWRLVTQLLNGQISVSRYETKAQCETAKEVAEHIPQTLEERAYSDYFAKKQKDGSVGIIYMGASYVRIGADIDHIECLDW